jgi:hypothetical protein
MSAVPSFEPLTSVRHWAAVTSPNITRVVKPIRLAARRTSSPAPSLAISSGRDVVEITSRTQSACAARRLGYARAPASVGMRGQGFPAAGRLRRPGGGACGPTRGWRGRIVADQRAVRASHVHELRLASDVAGTQIRGLWVHSSASTITSPRLPVFTPTAARFSASVIGRRPAATSSCCPFS